MLGVPVTDRGVPFIGCNDLIPPQKTAKFDEICRKIRFSVDLPFGVLRIAVVKNATEIVSIL